MDGTGLRKLRDVRVGTLDLIYRHATRQVNHAVRPALHPQEPASGVGLPNHAGSDVHCQRRRYELTLRKVEGPRQRHLRLVGLPRHGLQTAMYVRAKLHGVHLGGNRG